ncbi:PepSY domain-containing protein [Kordiimonas lipolytica]|uniref:PepSY domain-containing protein n=1 Tax=Kordiimonas lipolytica TaxID=1662421 RepID=A0ABV8U6A0_9PROT|nr:PepSY domain-containing protein [Kordiimonas lipolytica]
MTKQKWHKYIAQTHKWVALILGLQLIAWTAGGVVMSWIPLNEIRGRHNAAEQTPLALPADAAALMPAQALANAAGQPATQLTYRDLLGTPVALMTLLDGSLELRNAATGALMSPLSKDWARRIADADFAPEADMASVTLLDKHVIDYRGPLPVWQITFADAENTNIYVSPTEARVVGRRTDRWRLFDFFWMLHIMDYDEREDFNNPLLMITALSALLFSVSGICLLFFRFYRRDFNFILGKRKKA